MRRNKTWIKGFALAAIVPVLIACSSEDDSPVQGGEPQEVQVSISTRASESGDNFTWENNDQLKLYVTPRYGGNTTTAEHTLTYNNGVWSTFNATLPATVEACYPATATLTSCGILTNQSTGIAAADYMTTASSQQLNGTDLSLTLEHRLCKVTVTIDSYVDYNNDMPTVRNEVFHSYPTVTYNNDAWTGTGNLTSITPFKTESSTDGKHTYQAIIAPGSYEPFMTLTVNGKSRTVNYDQALVSGNAYTFTLTVSNNELTLTPTNTFLEGSGWGTENNEVQIN